jgi:hypothetical protein
MVQIKNNDTIKEIIKGANIQTNEQIPLELARSVVPTMEVNPALLRKANIVRGGTANTSSSTSSVYTTPTDRDFYLTSVNYFITKDAASDNASNTVIINVAESGDQVLISVPAITATALTYGTSLTFSHPIKLTRGTTVRMSSSFTAGVLIRSLNITGYTIEPSS